MTLLKCLRDDGPLFFVFYRFSVRRPTCALAIHFVHVRRDVLLFILNRGTPPVERRTMSPIIMRRTAGGEENISTSTRGVSHAIGETLYCSVVILIASTSIPLRRFTLA